MVNAPQFIHKGQLPRIEQISRLLAVLLAESGNYAYIDRIAYSQSRDLAIFYIREALRDFHSIRNRGWRNEKAAEEASKIRMEFVDRGIEDIGRISGMKELREVISLITARALAIAAPLIKEEEGSQTSSS
jgi:CRISPR-associated protein Csa5